MSFNAWHFVYDGIPSELYNLCIYSIDSGGGVITSDLGAGRQIVEDRTSRRLSPIVYGVTRNDPLQFQMTFGSFEPIDRSDFTDISNWLCGSDGYSYLEILEEGMEEVRYKCYMTDLQTVSVAGFQYAFTAKVICDCPYAYSYPYIYRYRVTAPKTIHIYNDSAHGGYVYPVVEITPDNTTQTVSIVNQSDCNREFKFIDLNNYDNETIVVDNARGIITTNAAFNPYRYFNLHFLRLVHGDNVLLVSGNGNYKFEYELFRSAGS